MDIDMPSCPAGSECIGWLPAEAFAALETSRTAKTAVAKARRECASRFRKIITGSFLTLLSLRRGQGLVLWRTMENLDPGRKREGSVHAAVHYAFDIFATSRGTTFLGIKRWAKTLNLLSAPGTVRPPPLASTRSASCTTSSGRW